MQSGIFMAAVLLALFQTDPCSALKQKHKQMESQSLDELTTNLV